MTDSGQCHPDYWSGWRSPGGKKSGARIDGLKQPADSGQYEGDRSAIVAVASVVLVLVHVMDVDSDASRARVVVRGAANPSAHSRRVTAIADSRDRRTLRDEDQIAL